MSAPLQLRRLGIEGDGEASVYARADAEAIRAEGFDTQERLIVRHDGREIFATLRFLGPRALAADEASLNAHAWSALRAEEGGLVVLERAPPIESMSHVRAKAHGHRLGDEAIRAIVADVAAGRYSDVQIASFITAIAGARVDAGEIVSLTRAMIDVGDRLQWDRDVVADKHSVGGLPGNRTTPIVVAIAAAAGLTMPKTSSRAITSPAGTADAVETITRVSLSIDEIRAVVEREGACLAWGGAVHLSPADDVIIRVARRLDLDVEGQLVASILSKKAAAGSTHVVVDVPVGPTAKVRSAEAADRLERLLVATGRAVGLDVRVVRTDGSQPVGRGIGPALEARDVLAVLQRDASAPLDLRERSLTLAAAVLEMAGAAKPGAGAALAASILDDGRALAKLRAICEAQGGFREPLMAALATDVPAPRDGRVLDVDNRALARLAKLAGAPRDPAAGVEIHAKLGDRVARGDRLLTVHAESAGEMAYALRYLAGKPELVRIG